MRGTKNQKMFQMRPTYDACFPVQKMMLIPLVCYKNSSKWIQRIERNSEINRYWNQKMLMKELNKTHRLSKINDELLKLPLVNLIHDDFFPIH